MMLWCLNGLTHKRERAEAAAAGD